MMSITHAVIALSGTTLLLGETSPLIIGLTVMGSLLPDIDTSKSLIGRLLFPISRWLENRHAHRTITHSLFATMLIGVVTFPLTYKIGVKPWLAISLGHLVSCFSDTCTKEGVGLFFPAADRAIYGNNPNYRLRTGSKVEYWILALFLLLSVWFTNVQLAGGFVLGFNQMLGIREGVEQMYNRYGGNHHIWVTIKGYNMSDISSIDSRFLLVGRSSKEYIVQDKYGVYRTGEDIFVEHISSTVGESATTSEKNIVLNDDDAIVVLKEMSQFNPTVGIYLSGTLEIDDSEELQIVTDPGKFEAVRKEGNRVTLELCPIEQAILVLKDQFVYGTLTAKMITPQPKGL